MPECRCGAYVQSGSVCPLCGSTEFGSKPIPRNYSGYTGSGISPDLRPIWNPDSPSQKTRSFSTSKQQQNAESTQEPITNNQMRWREADRVATSLLGLTWADGTNWTIGTITYAHRNPGYVFSFETRNAVVKNGWLTVESPAVCEMLAQSREFANVPSASSRAEEQDTVLLDLVEQLIQDGWQLFKYSGSHWWRFRFCKSMLG